MAKQPSAAAIRAAKDARAKKFLIILVVPFIALIAWQGPKTLKALKGGSPPAPAVTTPATTTPGLAGTITTATPSGRASALPDTDAQPDLLDGQLVSFSRFLGRDPFAQIVLPGANSDVAATVEVNQKSEDLAIGDSFPASDPTFKLVGVSGQSALIGLVSGSFSGGKDTITINVGETLVLAANDGARYAIKLVSVGSS
jgi:hypothetical protein